MLAELRWAPLALLALATSAGAADLVFDVEEVAPAATAGAFSLRVSVVHRGRWAMRQRLEQKAIDAQREFRRYWNMVETVHPLFPDPLHDEWKVTRDGWARARQRYEELVESYGPLRWAVASSGVLRGPFPAALRISEARLRDEAQVAEPGDEAAVRLEVFRRRWFRPRHLVATVERPIRLLPGTGAVFHVGETGFAVKIRSRWAASPCAARLAAPERFR